jgi:LPXTG-motif cell wall-anchored protein
MTVMRTLTTGALAAAFLVLPAVAAVADSTPTYPPALGGGGVTVVTPAAVRPDTTLPRTGAPLAALGIAGLTAAAGGTGILLVARRRRASA